MPKLHLSDNWFGTNVREDDGELLDIIVSGDPIEEIKSQGSADIQDARSALYASSDYLRHGIYDHPLTQEGLHIYAKSDLTAWRGTNLGVVSVYLQPNGHGMPIPSATEYPEGWAQLNRRNGRFYLTHTPQAYAETRSRKHDFIDGLLQGRGFSIRVLPFNSNKDDKGMGAADYVMLSWVEEDDEKAAEIRLDGISRAQMRRDLAKPVRQYIARNAGQVPENFYPAKQQEEPQAIASGPIMVVKYGSTKKSRFDITKLPPQHVVVYNSRSQGVTMEWDGSPASRLSFMEVARRGFPVGVRKN